jgi:hypothetical protein
MHKTIIAAGIGVLIAGLTACAPQPGYGPGYGYGPSYGYGQPAGYYGQPAYSQPAPNPLVQVLGAMMQPSGGGYGGGYGGPGYYQPAPTPYYGSPYGYR